VETRREGFRQTLTSHNGSQRKPAGKRLGNNDDIREARVALISKGTARAAQAGLDFIRDQRRTVMAGKIPGARPKRRADREDATFALNWFDNDGADGIVEFGFKVGDIVKTHELNAGHQWSKRLTIFRGMRYGK